MRNSLLVGIALTLTAVAVFLVSGALDLDLEPVALLGLAAGTILAVSSDRSAVGRVAAFAGGIAFALVGYAARALVLPDSDGGRAVAVAVVLLLVTLMASLTAGRLPLWAGVLGAGSFAGAYDRVYTNAPAELATTGVETLTVLLLSVAAGFLTGTLTRPAGTSPVADERDVSSTTVPAQPHGRRSTDGTAGDDVELDELLAS